jgi:hypothetical protein
MEQVWRQTEHPGDGDGLKSAFQRVRFPINKEQNMNATTQERAADIAETFGLMRKVHPSKLTLQCVNGQNKLDYYPMSDVVADSIYGGSKCLRSLLDVLANSDCPYVAQFKQALCDEYTDKNADELALYFEERGQ